MEIAKTRPIRIDLNEFKLHISLRNGTELTLHFNSPSRRFYLSVIALVVHEMKRLGKVTSIPLEGHHEVLALLNDTIGGSLGSSDKNHLLPRIYRKWQHALPDLEEAPLFKVLGRKKELDEGAGKTYPFTEAQKDSWANLFEYKGSEENVRLKFAIDKIGAGLDDVEIIYEDSLNGDAWERFISSLSDKVKTELEKEEGDEVEQEPAAPVPVPSKWKIAWSGRYRWATLIVAIGVVVGVAAVGIWGLFIHRAPQPEVTLEKKIASPEQGKSSVAEPPSTDVPAKGKIIGEVAPKEKVVPTSSEKASETVASPPSKVKVASKNKMAFPLPDKPSIAVLPFVNMSKDPEQEFFSDGLTEEIITALSKSQNLFVIARSSSSVYKGKPSPIGKVAEELGVRYVLEGSVRRDGDRIRISAQLIDAITGHHLWAERYDGKMRDVFALQDRITAQIVTALAVKLTPGERAAQGETENVAAYDEFLKGWEKYLRFTSDDFAKAIQHFKNALELDPKYGRAHAALALTYFSGSYGALIKKLGVTYVGARLLSRQYLKEALKNPTSTAYLVNARYYLARRQNEEAVSELEQALALDPNNPANHAAMGNTLFLSGRPREAVDFINRAIRLDPLNPGRYLYLLGNAQFCMGNLEEAAALIERGLRINPELTGSASWLTATYGLLGKEKEARAALEIYNKGRPVKPTIRNIMYFFPFNDMGLADRFAEGLIKAGVPGRPSEYLPSFKENRLKGEEIKLLLFGSTITGFDQNYPGGPQWWIERGKDGGFTWRGQESISTGKNDQEPILSDTGMSRIEGDMICEEYQKRLWGLEFCSTAFRNPRGTDEGKDEYFLFQDFGTITFSLVR
jgi:TolB-like protein/Flp pilus assembly protein TadD